MSDQESESPPSQTLTPIQDDATIVRLGSARTAMAKARRARQQKVIDEMKSGVTSVKRAVEIAGISYGTYKKWRTAYPDFAAKIDIYRNASRDQFVGFNGTFAQFRKRYFGMDSPWFHQRIIDAIENAAPGSITMVLIPPGHGKLLTLDTPIPTPTGWTTMGELSTGDLVFNEKGEPTTVQFVSEEQNVEGVRLTFSDGSSLDACVDHQWFVRRRDKESFLTGKRIHISEVVKTSDIVEKTYRYGRPNFSIPIHEPLQYPEADLPIDPYILGVWLGDGSTNAGAVTCSEIDRQIITDIELAGYELSRTTTGSGTCKTWHFLKLVRDLRKAAVFGNKHIPTQFLRASEKQRRALLEGLMDTDGSCSKGQCEFTTTNIVLAENVKELIHSLGYKVRQYGGRAMLNGIDHGPKYRLSFYPRDPVFRLTRKSERQVQQMPNDRPKWETIIATEKIGKIVGKCIQVDSLNGLYLAGHEMHVTHNTTLLEDWCNFKIATNPNFRISYGSGQIEHSKKVLRRVMNRMTRDGPAQEYVKRFGPFEPQEEGRRSITQTWSDIRFNVYQRKLFDERDYNMVALGMRSQIQGTRTDRLIVDDPQAIETLGQTDQLIEKFRQDWLSRPLEGSTIIVGTRVGDDDFYSRLIDDDLVDSLICIPALDEYGEILWPEKYDKAFYEKKKKIVGPIAWARNYMQDPISSGETTFTDEVIDPCKNALRSVLMDPQPKRDDKGDPIGAVSVYLGIDPSIGGKNATIAVRCDEKKLQVLDLIVNEQLNSTAAIASVANEFLYRYNISNISVVTDVVVETMAFQKGLSEDDAFNEIKRIHGFAFRDHLTGYNKYDEDLGVAAMVRSFQRLEIEIPWAEDRETQFRMGELIKELKAWRPNKRGSKLRQDRVMVLWFVWLRWRLAKGGYMADTTQFDTSGLPYAQGKVLVGGRFR